MYRCSFSAISRAEHERATACRARVQTLLSAISMRPKCTGQRSETLRRSPALERLQLEFELSARYSAGGERQARSLNLLTPPNTSVHRTTCSGLVACAQYVLHTCPGAVCRELPVHRPDAAITVQAKARRSSCSDWR